MKRLSLKKILTATAVIASGLLVQSCDVMLDSAIDGGPVYDGYYGTYTPGYYNNWWPSLNSPAFNSPLYWGNAVYPGNYIPPAPPIRPQRPIVPSRPPQWNGGGEPGPVINVGNVRPGNSGNGTGNTTPATPPSNTRPSRPSTPTVSTGNNRPSYTLTPAQLPTTTNTNNNGQRPGRH